MRRRWREPAAIAAEIDRIRSLRLDALRRFAVKPRACGAPRKRRWGLTARRGRAIP
jgi:hypothetical protein